MAGLLESLHITKTSEGFGRPGGESDLPIDVNYAKLVEWLVSWDVILISVANMCCPLACADISDTMHVCCCGRRTGISCRQTGGSGCA